MSLYPQSTMRSDLKQYLEFELTPSASLSSEPDLRPSWATPEAHVFSSVDLKAPDCGSAPAGQNVLFPTSFL
jgi:hypothetical protein